MSELYLGLMSGTSLDGIDVAVVRFAQDAPQILHAQTHPYTEELRDALLALAHGQASDEIEQLGRLDRQLGTLFADAALQALHSLSLSTDAIRAIGSHGQTVRHRPSGALPFTLQIADPNVIAEITGITTVADFRRRDMAAGGQGAPLVPAFHANCFRSPDEDRAVVNIGGMANLTLLPSAPDQPVSGFDTGPGNVLLDAWIAKCQGLRYDANGRWASSGRTHAALLRRLLTDGYFASPPPKSTGREHFALSWLESRLGGLDCAAEDVQATLLELTAQSIATALHQTAPATQRLLVCGGGAHNHALMQALADRSTGLCVESTARYGLDPDWVEAAAFAWMARETLAGRPSNAPAVTGACGPRILGGIYSA